MKKSSGQTINSRTNRALKSHVLSQAIEQSPSSIIITNAMGLIEYVNSTFTQVTGYTSQEVVGTSPNILKSPDTPESIYIDLWKTLQAGHTWRGEILNVKKNGIPYWDKVVIAPIVDNQGETTHFLGIQTDITETKHIEEKLKESEARTLTILNTAAEGIITLNEQSRIVSFNPSAEKMFGYSTGEVLGKTINTLFSISFCNEYKKDVTHFLGHQGELTTTGQNNINGIRKDGAIFPIELSSNEFHDGVGWFFVWVVRDITERKKMEDSLRDERNFVSAILATSGALIVVLDCEGKIARFNQACEEITGYTFDEIKGKKIWNILLLPEEADAIKTVFNKLCDGLYPSHYENHWLTKNGKRRLISWNNTALLDEKGQPEYIISTGIDVTVQRRAEAQAKERQAQLAHMDRISLMGEMATSLAHELNQPLTSIYAYTQACLRMLKTGRVKSKKFVEAVEQTGMRAEQAGEIIKRLTNFVRRQTPARAPVKLRELVDDSVEFISADARDKHVHIDIRVSESLPNVLVDRIQIQQVLMNLMRNSIEALSMSNPEVKIVTLCAILLDNFSIQVSVRDTGSGIDHANAEKVFNAFHTDKKEGMGMGLTISQSIIEAHGGSLWVETRYQGGAEFCFTLPIESVDS